MTREEAKIFLLQLNTDKQLNKSEHEALRIAIEVLEQQPCEDAISRQAVIDVIERWLECSGYNEAERHIMRAVQSVLYDSPSVAPQPKTGHWIGHREHCEMNNLIPSGLGSYFWCSECDCGIDAKEWHRNNYKYCPNCGCHMIEPQESEDK